MNGKTIRPAEAGDTKVSIIPSEKALTDMFLGDTWCNGKLDSMVNAWRKRHKGEIPSTFVKVLPDNKRGGKRS